MNVFLCTHAILTRTTKLIHIQLSHTDLQINLSYPFYKLRHQTIFPKFICGKDFLKQRMKKEFF